jgi:hypothetical protein
MFDFRGETHEQLRPVFGRQWPTALNFEAKSPQMGNLE